MIDWLDELRYTPFPFLLGSGIGPLLYFTKRDLLGEDLGPVQSLWTNIEARRILARQQSDGSWKYPGAGSKKIRSPEDYTQLETYRQLGLLVEKFGFDRTHRSIQRATEFLFAHQSDEGDFRGIYGPQYTPNYSAGIMELLIKAGYGDDRRIDKGFRWLLSMQQYDGGWAIPFRTVSGTSPASITQAMHWGRLRPDRSKPSSHLVTGVVLRAFSAHHRYRKSEAARAAGQLLSTRFFKSDHYIDRRAPGFWESVSFPFWFTDIVSSLDSLSLLGFSPKDKEVGDALEWLRRRQAEDGSFHVRLLRTGDKSLSQWVTLAICRVFKRFYSTPPLMHWSRQVSIRPSSQV